MKSMLPGIAFLLIMVSSLFSQTIIFEDDFESGFFGPEWHPHPGQDGIVDVVISIGSINAGNNNSLYGVAMGKSANGAFIDNHLDLVLNLAGKTNVYLSFAIKRYYEETHPQDGIWLFDHNPNINNFRRIYEFDLSNWQNNRYGQLPPINISRLAEDYGIELTDSTVIRWTQYGNNSFASGDGYFLDDIIVYEFSPTFENIPYCEDFEDSPLSDAWFWANPLYPSVTTASGTVRPGGLVEVTESINNIPIGNDTQHGLAMGRTINGNFTTNAIDLYLDLSNHTEVFLNFWYKDIYESPHEQDGIFFSDDGGETFEKASEFVLNDNVNVYGHLPPIDVDRIARDLNLSLTDSFVIRFQQYGNTGYASGYGFSIDDVCVEPSKIKYITVTPLSPFVDGFESGQLDSAWAWANPLYPALTTEEGRLSPQGIIEVAISYQGVDLNYQGDYGVVLGRRVSGEFNTNALDLHLDLSISRLIQLNFWVKDYFDATHNHDGIYMSDDGGESFVSVYPFDPAGWPNNQWREITLDMDSIIASNSQLSFSDSFIVRFQQYGNQSVLAGDGLFFDDISVTADSITVGIDDVVQLSEIPGGFQLSQNYPNPFNPSTTIEFALPSAQTVNLKVYNMLGQEIAALLSNERMPAGTHRAVFEAGDLPSGVYYYRITAREFNEARKMLLVR